MPFQFMCPQGHLLEGHESQMGQQVPCPLCGTLLIIPTIGPPGAAAAPRLSSTAGLSAAANLRRVGAGRRAAAKGREARGRAGARAARGGACARKSRRSCASSVPMAMSCTRRWT